MPHFEFTVVNAEGRRARGREVAASEAALLTSLAARGLTAVRVSEREHGAPFAPRVSRAATTDAVRALASLLAAGVPLIRALDVAATTAPPALAELLRDVRGRVERGDTLHAAMAVHAAVFSPASVGVVRAGERAGDLDGALDRLAAQREREDALRERLLSAAIYPTVLAIAGGAAILVLLYFVLPRFAALLQDTGLPLPRSTMMLLALATSVRAHWLALPVVAGVVVGAAIWLRATTRGRWLAARLLLSAPLVGRFRRDALSSSAARTLAVLLRGGAPLSAALEDAAASASDPLLCVALQRCRARIIAGSSLHAALLEESIFDDAFRALIATGEQAGRLVEFLERAADLLAQRTQRGAQRLVALAEPAMVIAFGVVIAVIALSLLQAIYGINPASLR